MLFLKVGVKRKFYFLRIQKLRDFFSTVFLSKKLLNEPRQRLSSTTHIHVEVGLVDLEQSPVRRLLCRLGESQGPRRSRCRMLGGVSCRENAKRVDVLERLVSRHIEGRGLERLNGVDTDSLTALEMKST